MAAKTKKSPVKKTRHFKKAKAVSKNDSLKQADLGVTKLDNISKIYLSKLHQINKYAKILIRKVKGA